MNETVFNGSDIFLLFISVTIVFLFLKMIAAKRKQKKINAPLPEKNGATQTELNKTAPILPGTQLLQPGLDDKISPLDALNTSLRRGFNVLRLLMIALALIFVFSNVFWVEEGHVALQSRFGRIINRKDCCVIGPGGPYFAFPAPIDRIVKVPTTLRKVDIDNAFWLESKNITEYTGNDDASDLRSYDDTLVPGYDGSLITADKNVVQGQWAVNYQLDCLSDKAGHADTQLRDFTNNVGTMEHADNLVRRMVIKALVEIVAQTPVDDFVRGKIDYDNLIKGAQNKLDILHTGIKLRSITGKKYTVAQCLQDDFRAVNLAESEKAEKIESAKRYRSEVLNETAGADYEKILKAIYAYESATAANNNKNLKAASDSLKKILQSDVVGGRISETFSSAVSYRTQVVEFTRGAAQRFILMLAQYQARPVIFRNRLIQDSLQTVFSGQIKTYYLPPGDKKTLYLELNK